MNIHSQLINVNPHLIAAAQIYIDNQPMIDTPQPESYDTFVEWLKAFCDYHGTQKAAAKIARVTPQAMTKWLAGGNITRTRLLALAGAARVSYTKLLLLSGQMPDAPADEAELNPLANLTTATEMGAKVGRKWERLYEPAKSQMLGLIETLLALQLPSHREYGQHQRELVKQRPKKPEKTT